MQEEIIIAVPREIINEFLKEIPFGFISQGLDGLYNLVLDNCVAIDRSKAETDVRFKQLIPYVIVTCSGDYFLSKRKSAQSEKRLHNKMSIGFGGHINPTDSFEEQDIIIGGLLREIKEELHIDRFDAPKFIGFINDDISEVGRVHLGLLFEIESASYNVEVIEKDKMDGYWASTAEIKNNYDSLESWSKIAFDNHTKS